MEPSQNSTHDYMGNLRDYEGALFSGSFRGSWVLGDSEGAGKPPMGSAAEAADSRSQNVTAGFSVKGSRVQGLLVQGL